VSDAQRGGMGRMLELLRRESKPIRFKESGKQESRRKRKAEGWEAFGVWLLEYWAFPAKPG